MKLLKRSHFMQRLVAAMGLMCALIACGGGGGAADSGSSNPPSGQAWQTAQFLGTSASFSSSADVAVNASGVGYAVWQEDFATGEAAAGSPVSLFSIRGPGPGEPLALEKVETDDTGSAQLPQIAPDASGRVMAVWQQSDGTRTNMRANRLDPVTGKWGTPELIETKDAVNASLAMSPGGLALAAWEQGTPFPGGEFFSVMGNVFK